MVFIWLVVCLGFFHGIEKTSKIVKSNCLKTGQLLNKQGQTAVS